MPERPYCFDLACCVASSSRCFPFHFQPIRRVRAGIAIAAGIPLGSFAEVAADVVLAALVGLHETLDFVIALPGAAFFSGVFDVADKEGLQTGVFFLPEEKAIGRERV